MTGYLSCVRLMARTGRRSLLAVPLILTALLAVPAGQMINRYPDAASRAAYAAAYEGVTGIGAFQGRGYELTRIGGMLANEMGFLALVFFPMAGLLLAVRHTRAIEDTGQLEILTAGRIGRPASLAAGATVVALSALLTAVLSTALLLALGYPARGSVLYAFTLALLLLTFAGIGLVAGQLAQTAPQAYGLGFAVFLVTYLLRAVLDVRRRSGTWSNPESWLAEVRPFSDQLVFWPWIAYLTTIVILTALAVWIAGRRDLGAGVITPRPGPKRAPAWASSPAGLLLRLTRGSALAWLIGSGVFALAFGLLGNDMAEVMTRAQHQTTSTAVDTLIALLVQINALFAGALGIQSVTAWAREERSGRLGWMLSAPVDRRWSWLSAAGVALGWPLITLIWTGILTGLGLRIGLGESSALGQGLSSTLAYLPAVLFITVLAMLLCSITPAAAPLGWILVVWELVVAFLGDPLDLSQGLRNISPLEWSGQPPLENWAQLPALATVVAAGLGLLVSTRLFGHRELTNG